VSPSGDAANLRTEAAPFATLPRASDAARAGDTIVVMPGQYSGVRLRTPGTAAAPITVRGMSRAAVVRPGNGTVSGELVTIYHATQSLDPGILVREHVMRYAVRGDLVRRVPPLATRPEDFLDEWVRLPWDEAARWTDPEARERGRRWAMSGTCGMW